MSAQIDEQETVVQISRISGKATVYTSDTAMLTKLHKLMKKNPEEWKRAHQDMLDGEVVSETYECPKKLISFRASTSSRVMTEEQRQAAAERLKKARENK